MNNRIKELAEHANEYANSRLEGPSPIWFTCFNEKFAELIALECAELMEQQHTWITSVAASKAIRVHFGVE